MHAERDAGRMTVAATIEFLAWHETYHLGQATLYRRAAGLAEPDRLTMCAAGRQDDGRGASAGVAQVSRETPPAAYGRPERVASRRRQAYEDPC
jgi:hypothetical protein